MSTPTRKRGERGDECAEDSDRAIEPSTRQRHTDSSGDDANSEGSRSATSRLWQVLYDLPAFIDEDDLPAFIDEYIDFQPKAFLALIEDVLCNNKDEVGYRVRFAARIILSSRIFHNLFKRLFHSRIDNSDSRSEEDDPVDELCLLHRIDFLRADMSRGEKDGPVDELRLIDRIVSHILFTMWEPGKDWSVDKLCQIERIVAFILDEINVEEDDQLHYLCQTKRAVSFIGEIIGEKDAQSDKLDLIWQIGYFICDGEDYFIYEGYVMKRIANYLDLLISRKDDPIYGLHLIDQTVSFFLNVKRAEKDGQADKVCQIERIVSFIDDIIGEKDCQVDKLWEIYEIVDLFVDINEFDETGLVDELILMEKIVTLLTMMIRGEKNDQVDKLNLIKQIISFLKADHLEGDKFKVMHHIISWTETNLLRHGSSTSVDEAFDRGFAVITWEEEQPMEGPTHDTINDKPTTTTRAVKEPKAYKRRSRYLKHFTEHGGNKWSCNLCEDNNHLKKILLQRNGSSSTTIFQRHLKRYHNDVYNKIERDAVKQKK